MDGTVLVPASAVGQGGGGETPAVHTPTSVSSSLPATNTAAAAAATTASIRTPTDLLLLDPSTSSAALEAGAASSSLTPAGIPTTPGTTSGRAADQSPFLFTSTTTMSHSSPRRRAMTAEKIGSRRRVFHSPSQDFGEHHSASFGDEQEDGDVERGYHSPLEEDDFMAVTVTGESTPTAAATPSAASASASAATPFEFDPLSFPQSPPQSPWPTPQQHHHHQQPGHDWGMSYYSPPPSQIPSAMGGGDDIDNTVILDGLVPQSSTTPSLMSSTMESSSSSTRRRTSSHGNSASRLRGGGGNSSNTPNNAAANNTPLSSSSGLRRPRNNNTTGDNSNSSSRTSSGGGSNSAAGAGNNANTTNIQASSTLRASLDAGMAAVRRWLRSHAFSASTSLPSSSSQHGETTPTGAAGAPARGRSVTWVFENHNDAASSSIESEDLFESTAHRNIHQHHHSQQQQQQQHYHHPTILEEDEDEEARGSARQRALSEPDAGRIRDWLFHQNRYSSSSTRRRRRRLERTYNRTFSESEVVVGGSGGGGRQLSSSAAAALHTQQQQQQFGAVSVAPGIGTDIQHEPIDLISSTNNTLHVNTSLMMHDRSFTDGGLDNIGAAAPGMSDHLDVEMATMAGGVSGGERGVNNNNSNSVSTGSGQRNRPSSPTNDRERRARIRWIRINRRFQLVITMVALLFSLLLFGILIGWIVLTFAYVVSFDKSCDLPLKPYFWLVTFQLVLDVFRNDIMRFVFNWDANSNLRIPVRVIVYNVAYLLYAFLVLRMGINNVIVESDATCRTTAPELFKATVAFVSLSIAAWTTIVCGYLLPFCIVAALLTYNGYNPSSSAFEDDNGTTQPVFPAAYSTSGAPTGTVELLRVVAMENYPRDYPLECCICMEEFSSFDVVVETKCKHIFHKQCCREWLRQARTCPVCRTDIPSSLEDLAGNTAASPTSVASATQAPSSGSRIPIGPTGRPVVGLFRMLQSESFHSTGGGGTGSRSNSPVAAATSDGNQNHS